MFLHFCQNGTNAFFKLSSIFGSAAAVMSSEHDALARNKDTRNPLSPRCGASPSAMADFPSSVQVRIEFISFTPAQSVRYIRPTTGSSFPPSAALVGAIPVSGELLPTVRLFLFGFACGLPVGGRLKPSLFSISAVSDLPLLRRH